MGFVVESMWLVESFFIGDFGDGSIGNNFLLLVFVLLLVVFEVIDLLDLCFFFFIGGRIVIVLVCLLFEGGGVGFWVGLLRWLYLIGIDMVMW